MTRFLSRLAVTIAAASVPLAAGAVATSPVGSAACDPNWSHDVLTGECRKPPPPPDWWMERPAYAPPYAPLDVPPPPPPPPWAREMHPNWDEGSQQWVWVRM